MKIQDLATSLREEFINDKSLKKKEAKSLTDIEIISYANKCLGCEENHLKEKMLKKVVEKSVTPKHFWAMVYAFSDHFIENGFWFEQEDI